MIIVTYVPDIACKKLKWIYVYETNIIALRIASG